LAIKRALHAKSLFVLFILSMTLALPLAYAQQFTPLQTKIALIYNIIKYINWPKDSVGPSYVLGVYGEHDELYRELKSVAHTFTVHGKPLEIKKLNSLYQSKGIQVLVLPKSENIHLQRIASELIKTGILIISDDAFTKSAMMINIHYPRKGRIAFEINRSNIIYEGLSIAKKILLLGGTEMDVATIYKDTEQALQKTKHKYEEQRQIMARQKLDIHQQQQEIVLQGQKIQSADQELLHTSSLLNEKEQKLQLKESLLQEKIKLLILQNKKIVKKELALNSLEENITVNLKILNEQKNKLKSQDKQLHEQHSLISSQTRTVSQQGSQIEGQQQLLWGAAITLATISLLIISLYRQFRLKQKTNSQLAFKNNELQETMDTLKRTQDQLILSEKMAALGQLVASVAHEVNTPLGAIQSSSNTILDDLNFTLASLPHFFDQLEGNLRQLFIEMIECSLKNTDNLSSREERSSRRTIVEELSSRLPDRAEELADVLVDMKIYKHIEPWMPLLLHANSESILQFAYKLSRIERNARIINIATHKASKVVLALKTYSHSDQSKQFSQVDIKAGIDTVLTLYHNQIKHGVDVTLRYMQNPNIWGSTEELSQVWTNIIHNSLQAMVNKGQLKISVRQSGQSVFIEFEDDGPGIPEDVQPRVFEAFFTTKASGEGTGIGLDISRKIVEKHLGKLSFISEPGCTIFTVQLPVNQDSVNP